MRPWKFASPFGYFEDPTQLLPTYEPGLTVPCVVCQFPMTMENVVNTSLILPGDTRSYFYRLHRSCRVQENAEAIARIEGELIDSRIAANG